MFPMQISKFRVLLSFIAALGGGAAVYGILRSYSWAIYVAVVVGYTAGVFCLGWQAGLAERCFRSGFWHRIGVTHTMFVAAVMILLRIWLYGDSNLPHWLTRSYVSYGRFSPEPRTSTVLADAISVAVLALMVIEAFWVRQKLSPESEQTTA
jgi:hypothetical protein